MRKYNTQLADRIREALIALPVVEEKEMFNGLCFMVNGKMCICVSGDEMLCRIGAVKLEISLENSYTRQMIMRGKPSKDFIFISEEGFNRKQDFDNWIKLALDFNPEAKASKKKTRKVRKSGKSESRESA